MKYREFDDAEGKQGGPFLDELRVLEREKLSAGAEDREPRYQLVLDELYSGNLPTVWEEQPEVKDAAGTVINPEGAVWEPLDHDEVVFDKANSPEKQRDRDMAVQDRLIEKDGADAFVQPFGNVGNQDLDESARPEAANAAPVFDGKEDEFSGPVEKEAAEQSRKVSAGVPDPKAGNDDETSAFDDNEDDEVSKPAAKKAAAKKTVTAADAKKN